MSRPWLVLVGVGLGTARLVDCIKPFVALHRNVKTALAGGISLGAVLGFLLTVDEDKDWRSIVAVAMGAWGLSQVTHGLTSYLQSAKDETRDLVLQGPSR